MNVNIHCKYDELVNPKSLKNHPKNRNKHGQDQIERLAELYKYHGIRHPIIVSNLTGCIVAGHGRKLAALRAGLTEVPVVYQDFDSSEAEYAFIQADNAIALWAELDLGAINTDLTDLGPDFDIDMLGIRDFKLDLNEENEGHSDPDEVPEDVPTKAKLGDLFILGNHRLLCGDSTDVATVERLMNGEKAEMVFTDPPYGINLDTSGSMSKTSKRYSKIIGDQTYFDVSFILKRDAEKELWIWGANYFVDKIGLQGTWTVWDKKTDDEINTNWDGRFGNDFEICWTNLKTKQSLVRKIVPTGFFARGDEKRIHPTQKPTRLIEHYLTKICKSSGSVLDYFGGSGSTLIACEKTNRKCFMMELDPHYIDVIVARWQKFANKKAIREDGVLWDDIQSEVTNG